MRNKLFGFGYYEGHRNTNGATQNIVVLTDAQRAGNFGATTIRDPLTGLPFPNNTIPANRISPIAAKLIDQFVPQANERRQPLHRLARRHRRQSRSVRAARFDYQVGQNNSLIARYMRSQTESLQPPTTRPIGTCRTATLQDVMVSDHARVRVRT